MPINEINAPYYIKGKYGTAAYPKGHAFRLYFKSGTVLSVGLSGDEENWRVVVDGTDQGSVAALVADLFTRAHSIVPANTHILSLELWHSIPDAPNVLVHLNTLPEGNSYGSGAGFAAGYTMLVFGTELRPQFRFTFFDGVSVAPQKVALETPPAEDDGTLEWLFIKSDYALANNDGEKLTRPVSGNTGYNRKLARTYGRAVAP